MARPKKSNIVEEQNINVKEFAKLNLSFEPAIKNTLIVNENGVEYLGDILSLSHPYDGAADVFRINSFDGTVTRNTGAYIFELDSGNSVSIIKVEDTIYLYQVNSGSPMTAITTLTTSTDNVEVYLEAIFCSTEKAAITGYVKYVFLNLPGEAWVVAYSSRTSGWQVTPVASTYSAWVAVTNYSLGDRRIPTVANGYYYEVSVDGGSSGAAEPTWPTTLGDTVTDGGLTWVCRGRYNNFPTTTSSSVKTLNGYIFVCVGGDIYNSDLDIPDSWNPSDFISTEIYPDDVQALAKYKNYLVAFGDNTIEFFYDAANTSGTPLARQEGILHNIGCIGQSAVVDQEDTIYWLSQTSSATYSIWTLDKFEAKKVSSPELDVVLTKSLANVINLYPNYRQFYYLYLSRLNGSLLLHIPLLALDVGPVPQITKVLVFDVEKSAFYEWNLTNTTGYRFIGKPTIYKNYHLYISGDGSNVYFIQLGIQRYTSVLATFVNDLFQNVPEIEVGPLDFNSNNFKVLNELSFNVFSSFSTNAYLYVSLDRASFTGYLLTTNPGLYKITRLGRAREFRLKLQNATISSRAVCKYTEHTN